MGVVKSQHFLSPGSITHEADRHDDPPWGVFGGQAGHGGRVETHNAATPAAGDVMTYLSPCGGYGNRRERDPHKVSDDILDGYIMSEHAAQAYGVAVVAVDDGHGWARRARPRCAARAAHDDGMVGEGATG